MDRHYINLIIVQKDANAFSLLYRVTIKEIDTFNVVLKRNY